jgi:NADH-quinone oxidoreductase subunit N
VPATHLAPLLVLTVGTAVTLVLALTVARERQWWCAPTALVTLAASGTAQVWLARTSAPQVTFDGLWALDDVTHVAMLLLLAVAAVVVLLTPEWLATDRRHGEYHALVLLATLGSLMMVAAVDLNELLIGVLLSSATGYTLAAYHRGSPLSAEAGMKFFVIGALANLALLLGVTLLFGAAGSTSLDRLLVALPEADPWLALPGSVLTIVGLSFKVGAAPAHGWMPDVAEGAPVPSAALLTVLPKVGALVALVRLVDVLPDAVVGWRATVAVLAVATMTIGNLAALRQDDVRRLLGWSSVSQAGYALIAVVVLGTTEHAIPALLLFMTVYAAAQLAAFGVVAELRGRTRLSDYVGLGRARPWLSAALAVALLSLVGIPPLGGFAGKVALFTAALDGGYGWLAAVAVANTVVSLFYYLRVLGPMYLGAAAPRPVPVLGAWAAAGVVVATVAVVVTGVGAGWLLDVAPAAVVR